MSKEALLVAVGDYQGYAQELTAPVPEMKRWETLLKSAPYSFDKVTPLADGSASLPAVKSALMELLRGAQKDEQRVFVFLGHGSVVPGDDPRDGEASLMLHPQGDRELSNSALRESVIKQIIRDAGAHPDADITFVLDCCFAANYSRKLRALSSGGVMEGAIPLAIPPLVNLAELNLAEPFSTLRGRDTTQSVWPIVIAAAEAYETAWEIWWKQERRMLFSSRFLEAAAPKQDTFAALIRSINPLHPDVEQTAVITGNKGRQNELFPGQPGTAPPPSARTSAPATVRASADSSAATDVTNSIDIRVLGLASFINSRKPETDPYAVRLVLPYDGGEYVPAANRHFGAIEVAEHDLLAASGLAASKTYMRAGVRYKRWLLSGHTIAVASSSASGSFQRSAAFVQHVPNMTQPTASQPKPVAPELGDPRDECFAGTPRPDLFAAFLDVPGGSVDIGPLEQTKTKFQRPSGEFTWGGRGGENTPISVVVNVPIDGSATTITLHAFPSSSQVLSLTVASGSEILLANARTIDIEGDGSGSTSPDQFKLYYKLAKFFPPDAPGPILGGVPIDACSVTDWP